MGSVVLSTYGAVMPSCGVYNQRYGSPFGMGGAAGVRMGAGQQFYGGYEPYVDVINRGWTMAMNRMLAEAKAVNAHGIVGIDLTQRRFEGGAIEFMAMGTAVRSTVVDDHHGRDIFTTHLDGQDVSKLVHHGWMPVRLIVEVTVAVRHDDYNTLNQGSMFAPNAELTGFSDLSNSARASARQSLQRHLKPKHEVGTIIDSLDTHIFRNDMGQGHSDHLCEVRVAGTTIAQSGVAETRMEPLSIIYLKSRKAGA
jgi:uncharacterized protein YbjQ (UPF0145 family)